MKNEIKKSNEFSLEGLLLLLFCLRLIELYAFIRLFIIIILISISEIIIITINSLLSLSCQK